jgi:hypothetical protein
MSTRHKFTKETLDACYVGSVEKTTKTFKSNLEQWERSKERAMLDSIIRSVTFPTLIQKIITVACGSIANDVQQEIPRSSFQHAFICTLRDIFMDCQRNLVDIQCYAQDPAYSEADTQVLTDYGFTILDDPDGLLEINESALLFSCAAEFPVKQVLTELAQPAAIIWDRVKEPDPTTLW